MRPRPAQLMTCALIAMAALSACRKEVPTPTPDREPKPTVQVAGRVLAGGAWLAS